MGNGPANEAQARELVPLLRDEGEEAVVEVWRELRSDYGDALTAAVVRDTVRAKLETDRRIEEINERSKRSDHGWEGPPKPDDWERHWRGLPKFVPVDEPVKVVVVFENPVVDPKTRRERRKIVFTYRPRGESAS